MASMARCWLYASVTDVLLMVVVAFSDIGIDSRQLVSNLENLLDGFQGSLTHICCFAHTLNLVVKVCFEVFAI
jgi:hypothetical protein